MTADMRSSVLTCELVPETFCKGVTMRKCISIAVFEVVGSPLCVASGDGQKICDRLFALLQKDCRVTLSFRNVTKLTAAFLNAAIGQLYGTFSEEQIHSLLTVEDMEPDDLALLKRVVDTAKMYFKDPQRFDQVVRETLEDNMGKYPF